MLIAVFRERHPNENRVALVPAHIQPLRKAGHSVLVEQGAGLASGYPDSEYQAAGAELITDVKGTIAKADIVAAVRAAGADEGGTLPVASMKAGAVLIAMMDPYQSNPAYKVLLDRQVTGFALELIPRITRSQSMDVLSSQANISGYKGVLLATQYLPKMYPMFMTAAGTITPAKVFILGAGVAGLQAIACAKRLGAVVSAFDVRPAVKEQVQSLGGKFVEFDIGAAEGTGGYAKELTAEQKAKQQELMDKYVGGIDVIVSTAAVPGRPSPKLITKNMVKNMPKGSVIVDLASERGGNCELTQPGKVIVEDGVTIVGLLNIPSTVPFHASQLYSKNVTNFLGLLINKEQQLSIDLNDEIVAATLVTHQGKAGGEKIAQTLGI